MSIATHPFPAPTKAWATLSLAILFVASFALPAQAAKSAGKRSREVVLIYSGQSLGELKPCGCAREEDQGGIERRMTYLRESETRFPHQLRVDVGDNFKEPTRQGKLKADFLLKSMARMNYDAVTIGDKDLVYGNNPLFDASQIPWLSSNIKLGGIGEDRLPVRRIKTFANGVKALIAAVSDPALFYTAAHTDIQALDPKQALAELLARVRADEKPDLVIVLSHMRRDSALSLLDLEGVDVVVNGHIETENDTIDMKPVERQGKIFVQPGPKGQKIGELRIRFADKGKKRYSNRMVRLDSSVKFDPEMIKLYEEYNDAVEALYLEWSAQKRNAGQAKVFATDQVCKTCHADIHGIWEKSRHAGAYRTLQRVNKAFDPECLACHTLGFNKPGGFVSEVDTPGLANVQCEICHGAALEHATDPVAKPPQKPANQACGQCHVRAHSPAFRFEDYWPKIKH